MAYEIVLVQEIANEVGQRKVTVQTLDVVAGCLHVGSYYVPLNAILFVKEV